MILISGQAGSLSRELEVDRLDETGPAPAALLGRLLFDSESLFDFLEGSPRLDHVLHFFLFFFDDADEAFDVLAGLGIGMARKKGFNPG